MSTVTTATAHTHTGVLIRCLLDELAFIHSPLYTAVHTTDEIAAAEREVWEAITDAATRGEVQP